MLLTAAFFWLFAIVTILSAIAVVTARNPVHSVLFLILAFVNAAGLFLLLGAEFLAMILVVVYVGAVAVLFLFVVMMLDVDFAELKKGMMATQPGLLVVGLAVAAVVVIELVMVMGGWLHLAQPLAVGGVPLSPGVSNTQALGLVLYTRYFYLFQAAGFVLLTAMIGAIVLTLRHKPEVKRQSIEEQNARTRSGAIEIVKVRSRTGVEGA